MTGDGPWPVEQMFAFIRKARTSRPVRIEAQHEVRGYPTRVCDPATTTDDEFGFVTSDFKVLRCAKIDARQPGAPDESGGECDDAAASASLRARC
jgi:hypothetical protein